MKTHELTHLARKYWPEIQHVIVSVLVMVVIFVLNRFLTTARVVDSVLLGLLAGNLVLLIGLGFSIKRHVTWKVAQMEEIITEVYGAAHQQGQFARRKAHWPEEKEVLCRSIVKDQIPLLLSILTGASETSEIGIIIDSGTTLCPVFAKLKTYGLRRKDSDERVKADIYTNSLAGIDAFNREISFGRGEDAVGESAMHLVGGNPLERYRATTGEEALAFLKSLRERSPRRKFLGIVTANWILMGQHFDKLTICARGRGHPEFKKAVVGMCDVILVSCPNGSRTNSKSHAC